MLIKGKNWRPVIAVIVLLMLSCKSNKVTIPKGIEPPDTLVNLLTDVHVLQAMTIVEGTPNLKPNTSDDILTSVCRKHHITVADYKKTLGFYSSHIELLDSVYVRVLDTLSKRKAELRGKTQP
jgi:hypothetical protein